MARTSWLRPFMTVGIVAGLLIATILTATAASEAQIFGQSAETESEAEEVDAAQREWVWVGEVKMVSLDDNGSEALVLSGPCGVWRLLPANDEVGQALQGQIGGESPVFVVGSILAQTLSTQRPTIRVEQVVTDKSEIPEDAELFPKCQQRPAPHPQPHPRPYNPASLPNFMSVLQRLGLQGLHQVPPRERFDHFLGAEVTYTDADDVLKTARLTAGVVTGVGTETLTLDPNGPETSMTVTVTEDTKIIRPGGDDSLDAIEIGDRVLVLQVNGETVAIVASDEVTVWPGMMNHKTATARGGAVQASPVRPFLGQNDMSLRSRGTPDGMELRRFDVDPRLRSREIREAVQSMVRSYRKAD